MPNSYSIAEAKGRLPQLVHEAEAGRPVEITRRGRAVAVLLSTGDYARLTEPLKSLWLGIRELRAGHKFGSPDEDDLFADVRDPSPGRAVNVRSQR